MFKKKSGFTLIELIIVVAILAVITAITIPVVVGITRRAEKSTDNDNASKMTNAISQWSSEFNLIGTDLSSNALNENDTVFGRVSNTAKEMGFIGNINTISSFHNFNINYISSSNGVPKLGDNTAIGFRIMAIEKVYLKATDDIFKPKQSDCSYWYLKGGEIVLCAKSALSSDELTNYAKELYKDSSNNFEGAEWINLTNLIGINKKSVNLKTTGGGTVTGNGSYTEFDNTKVTAQAKDGSSFIGWFDDNGNVVSTDQTLNFKVGDNTNLTAKFTAEIFTMNFVTDGGGKIESLAGSPYHGSGQYTQDTELTINATPDTGYKFSGWYIDGSYFSSAMTFKFTVTESHTMTAKFEKIKYKLTLSSKITDADLAVILSGRDEVTFRDTTDEPIKLIGGGEYEIGSTASISALGGGGYAFQCWDIGQELVYENSASIKIDKNTTVTAWFQELKYNITYTSSYPDKCNISYNGACTYNSTAVLTASTNIGYSFKYWADESLNPISYDSVYSFKVTKNVKLTAIIEPIKYKVSVTTTNEGVVEGVGEYEYGTEVTLYAHTGENLSISNPNIYYKFKNWREDGNSYSVISTDSTFKFNIYGNVNIIAEFKKTDTIQAVPKDFMAITTLTELSQIGNELPSNGKYILMNDLNGNYGDSKEINGHMYSYVYGANWPYSPCSKTSFSGVIEGNGHTISNIYFSYSGQERNIGLFGDLNYATISNLYVSDMIYDSRFTSASTTPIKCGAIAGYCSNSNLTNCKLFNIQENVNANLLNASFHFGGLVGNTYNSNILQCEVSVDMNISGNKNADFESGFVVGNCYGTTLKNLLVIEGTYNSTNDTTWRFGGIAGYTSNSILSSCKIVQGNANITKNTTLVIGIGGIAGSLGNNGNISKCSVNNFNINITRNTSTSMWCGLIAGIGGDNNTITDCEIRDSSLLCTLNADGELDAGGIIGYTSANSVTISDIVMCNNEINLAKSTSITSSNSMIGGVIGRCSGSNCTIGLERVFMESNTLNGYSNIGIICASQPTISTNSSYSVFDFETTEKGNLVVNSEFVKHVTAKEYTDTIQTNLTYPNWSQATYDDINGKCDDVILNLEELE